MSLQKTFTNIEGSSMAHISDHEGINIRQSQKDYSGGRSWEDWTNMFTREPEDKIYSFYEFEQILKSIHPNLCIEFNRVIGSGHVVYLDFGSMPIFVTVVGKACDDEIPPESGFIKPDEDDAIQETIQDYAGYKQAFVAIKIKFVQWGIKSAWDMGDVDAANKIMAGDH